MWQKMQLHGPGARGVFLRGLPNGARAARTRDMLDVGFITHCQQAGLETHAVTKTSIGPLVADTSQDVIRSPWQFGRFRCSTTAAAWYSYEKDRVLVRVEYFRQQGYNHKEVCVAPCSWSLHDSRDLVGEGMSLPSLASVIREVVTSSSLAARRIDSAAQRSPQSVTGQVGGRSSRMETGCRPNALA